MKLRAPLYSILALGLLVLLCMSAPTASAAEINGWTSTAGPGFELYMTSSQLVNHEEAALLINYGEADLVVKVIEHNQTIFSQIIEPQRSQFLVLPFPNVETDYLVTISADGDMLHTLTKQRPTYYLPPPKDSGWHIAPPRPADPLEYTQRAVDALVASLTLEVLLITLVVTVTGFFVGAGIKAWVRFIAPIDIVSIGIFAFTLSDLAFDWTGLGIGMWYAPFACGYILGFLLWHIDYIMPIRTDCAEKRLDVNPLVIYRAKGTNTVCVQSQTNKALIKRWLGIHHELGADGSLNPDWQIHVKKPWLPAINAPALWVQKEDVTREERPLWRWRVWHYMTQLSLSNASLMPKYYWLVTSKAFLETSEQNNRLYNALVDERINAELRATRVAGEAISRSVAVSPARILERLFDNQPEEPERPDTGETVMYTIEDVASEPEEVQDDEEEQPEEPKKPRKRTAKRTTRSKRKPTEG